MYKVTIDFKNHFSSLETKEYIDIVLYIDKMLKLTHCDVSDIFNYQKQLDQKNVSAIDIFINKKNVKITKI